MGINSYYSYYSTIRLTGMATGLDTDSLVSALMSAERSPLNALYQKKQLAEWKRDAYREITSLLKSFKDEYMDVLKPSTYMLSSQPYKKFTSTIVGSKGTANNAVSVTAGSSAVAGSHSVVVKPMATAAKATGSTGGTRPLESTQAITDTNLSGKTIRITLDGVTKEIVLDNYDDVDDMVEKENTGLQAQIDKAFGAGKIKVKAVTVDSNGGQGIQFCTATEKVSRITLSRGTSNDGLSSLQFASGSTNRLSTGLTLGQLASQFSSPLSFQWDNGAEGSFIKSTSDIDVEKVNWQGKKFKVTVDGVTKEITIDSNPDSMDDLASKLNELIDNAFGDKIDVKTDGGKLVFEKSSSANDVGYFSLSAGTDNSETEENENALDFLNITTGQTASGYLKFSINSKEFTIKANQSLASMMSTINNDSTANVTIKYDEANDNFTIVSKQLGAGENIRIKNIAGNFFEGASGINAGGYSGGKDAEIEIDGQEYIRSSNSITIDGVTYTLLREASDEIYNVTLTVDVDTVFNNIVQFVNKYNEMIDTINKKLSEEYDRNYQPLTDDQKKAMTEDEIKKWEAKAKTGLLRNDSILQNIVLNMRRALYDSVEGVSISLTSIGISTGNYTQKGKLIIDETKLREAIQNNPDEVMNLFSKQSKSYSSNSRTLSTAERQVRYKEEGLAYRLYDIIEDNISTYRDRNGNKGLLLQKAGMIGDASEFSNVFYNEIKDYEDRIYELNQRLLKKENAYYTKFAALESALSKLNSQSSWLATQLGLK
mgnify:FL=1